MPALLDLLYVLLFAVALPLIDYLVFWPASKRRLEADPARARRRLWAASIPQAWALVAAGAVLWRFHDRSWSSFGFSVPEGWRLWVSIGLVVLLLAYLVPSSATVARSAEVRASVRQQCGGLTAAVLPHTRTDMYWFAAVSLTAGFCEEFLFRGYFIWVLSPWLGWWGAAALSLLIFASGHAYQGWSGVLRTGVVGLLFTLVVAILGSLWPAIVLHALVDLGMGFVAWLALREGPSGTGLEAEARSPSGGALQWILTGGLSLAALSCGAASASDALGDSAAQSSGEVARAREGGQVCLGCRLYRAVRIATSCEVLAQTPTACSTWVAEHVPDHRHDWTDHGCWEVTFDGATGNALGADPIILSVSDETWLAYLQSLPPDRLSKAVGPDWPGSEEALHAVAEWEGASR